MHPDYRLPSRISLTTLLLTCLLPTAATAANTIVSYELTPLGPPAQYEYRYTFTNLSAPEPLRAISIDLDPAFYDEKSLRVFTPSPADWTQRILPSVLGAPAQLDVYSSSGAGMGAGNSLTGFGFQFTWLGRGVPPALFNPEPIPKPSPIFGNWNPEPGNQAFTVYDFNTFNVLETGWVGDKYVAPIPEPSTSALLLAGITLLGFTAWRRRAS
jgi:hypothetical protein